MKDGLLLMGAALAGITLFKGREIRSLVTMTGAGWENLHPDVKTKASQVLSEANATFKPNGLSVGIFEGWRTIERQREVMQTGNSFVANPLDSYHPWGLAVDFVFLDKFGRWTWEPFAKNECAWYEIFCTDPNKQAWQTLGAIIKKHGFEWGGDWQNFDGPHAQLTHYGRTKNLISAYNTPENFREVWT